MSVLTVGVIQMGLRPTLEGNRWAILDHISSARDKGCRVAIFPETALAARNDTPQRDIDRAVEEIRREARAHDVYVVMGLHERRSGDGALINALLVIDPEGTIIQHYLKLYNVRPNRAPGIFFIDDVPCSAILCADRWIRSVEDLPAFAGSQVIIECSNNYANEWIPALGWQWCVPRAVRSNVYVVFANTGTAPDHEKWDPRQPPYGKRHGHSAVIDPSGHIIASIPDDAPDRILVAALDPERATRAEAISRRDHPIVGRWWRGGLRCAAGDDLGLAAPEPLASPEVPITIAVAQMGCSRDIRSNVERMVGLIRRAAAEHAADIVAFPELAVTGYAADDIRQAGDKELVRAVESIQRAAQENRIAVAFGAPLRSEAGWRNCTLVVGEDGRLLTQYAQVVVDRPDLFAAGDSLDSMWFRLKGVPAVITVGRREGLWSEIAEMAALRGAQVHLHLEYDPDVTPEGALSRRQIWSNLAAYRTFTAAVNAASPRAVDRPSAPCSGGSVIYEDFRQQRGHGEYAYSPVQIASADEGERLIRATCTVGTGNPHMERMTTRLDSAMREWYVLGASITQLTATLSDSQERRASAADMPSLTD